MNNRFELDNKLLIILPTKENFEELKVKFEDPEAKILYLAQIRELSEENSYDTYVFYHKDGKSFVFYEFENPTYASYFTNVKEISIEEYWKTLEDIDNMDKSNFFNYSKIDFNYKKLDGLIPMNGKV